MTDQTGGAIPGATVSATNLGTGHTRESASNEVGMATLATLPPGKYSVRVSLTGFKEFATSRVSVTEDAVVRVSGILEVGQLTDSVTVCAGVEPTRSTRCAGRAA